MSRWRNYIRSLPWRLAFAVPMAIGGYLAVVETTASSPEEGAWFGAVLAFICLWPGKRGRRSSPHHAFDNHSSQEGGGDGGGGDGDGGD
ncbi:hypothetical protein GLV89_04785 [Halomonas alkaliantarctica]|nr:hypothetical protein [Halomonas alkaliantarctica]